MVAPIEIEVIADTSQAQVSLEQLTKAQTQLDDATKDYNNSLSRINQAVADGLITQRQASVEIDKLGQEYQEAAQQAAALTNASTRVMRPVQRTARAVTQVGRATSGTNQGLRNLGLQLNQVGQQAAAGTGLLQAFAIQLPDILGGLGGIAPLIAGTALGLGTALVPALLDTTAETEAAEEALEQFEGALDSFQRNAALYTANIRQLREEFGRFAEEVQGGARLAAQADLTTAFENLDAAIGGLDSNLTQIERFQESIRNAEATLRNLQGALDPDRPITIVEQGQIDTIQEIIDTTTARSDALAEQLGLTTQQALSLVDALGAIRESEGPEELATNAAAALDLLNQSLDTTQNIPIAITDIVEQLNMFLQQAAAANVAVEDINDEFGDTAEEARNVTAEVQQINRTVQNTIRLKAREASFGRDSVQYLQEQQRQEREALELRIRSEGISEELANRLREALAVSQDLASLELDGGINSAAAAARTLADELGIAFDNALALAQLQQSSGVSLGFGGGVPTGTPAGPGGLPMGSGGTIGTFGPGGTVRGQRLPRGATSRPTRRGRGGGGGGRGTDDLPDELQSVQDALATEAELLLQAQEEQERILKESLDRRLISQQEFEELSKRSKEDYNRALAELDLGYQGGALEQAQTFFGDLAGAFGQGNENLLRISKAFAAAEATINAYRAYNQVVSDPSLPWFAKIPAAISVFTNALATVNAIRGIGGGGGGGGGAPSGGGSGAGAAAATPQSATTLDATVRFIGDPSFAQTPGAVDALADQLLTNFSDRGISVVRSV